MKKVESTHSSFPDWRQNHLGRLLGQSMRRFDERVYDLMSHDVRVPLALSNLASRGQVSAAHVHITRHLPLEGAQLTQLAQSAGMSKQAMAQLVDQCEAWGLVFKDPDVVDKRAKKIQFTALGISWLRAFELAVLQAEQEFKLEVGLEVATVISLGLEVYADSQRNKRNEF
ncbi:MAG: MarR family transcriptional regulator [Betaproteobacteria bacterium]|jgi:DNA-binding MarR family transcriptional regulator